MKLFLIALPAFLFCIQSSAQVTIEIKRAHILHIDIINKTDSNFQYLNFSIACYNIKRGALLIYPDRVQRSNDSLKIFLNDTTRHDHVYQDGLADTIKKLAGLYTYEILMPGYRNVGY